MTSTTTTGTDAPVRNGDYVDVDGVATYYEVSGPVTGEPVLLLHGGLCTAETWDAQTPALAERYRVYVPERHAHGRTRDVEGPITYETMAAHTIGFMEALGIESAHLVGWSDGALVGLLVALRRPGLVRKLVLVDQFIALEDAPPSYLGFMTAMTPAALPPGFVDLYAAVSPDGGDHFPVVFEKLHQLWLSPTGVDVADLEHVAAPTLVLAGDDGAVTLTHAAAMRAALRDCQVAVVPNTSHGVTLEKPHVVNQLLLDFLAPEQSPKFLTMDV